MIHVKNSKLSNENRYQDHHSKLTHESECSPLSRCTSNSYVTIQSFFLAPEPISSLENQPLTSLALPRIHTNSIRPPQITNSPDFALF